MRLLLLAQLRFVARAPWSAVTAMLGVALAVASVVAVHQIGAAVTHSLDAARPPHLAGLTHVLERPDLTAVDYFELRAAWRRERGTEVSALVPVVEGYLELDGRRVRVLGADWLAYPGVLGVERGTRPSADGGRETGTESAAELPALGLLAGTAAVADRSLGVGAGAAFEVAGTAVEIVAVVDGGMGPALYTDIAVAQRLLRRAPDSLSFIGALARDPWTRWRSALDALMPGFAAGLPEPDAPATLTMTGLQARAIASELPAAAFARAILFNVGALGLLALLVAWFLVHQVALIWVERQRAVFVRLHALGVAHGLLCACFVALFVVIGAIATLVGTGGGLWLADALIRFSAPDVTGRTPTPRVDAVLLAKAALSGVGVCMAGGWLAFRNDVARGRTRTRIRIRPVVLAAATLLLVIGLVSERTGLIGGFGAILAMSLLTVAAIRPLLDWLRPGPAPRRGTSRGTLPERAPGAAVLLARLAVREAVWRPEVVTVALAALALAVATSMGVGLMVDSLRSDFGTMLEARLSGDLFVEGPVASIEAAAAWLAGAATAARVARHGEVQIRVAPTRIATSRVGSAPTGAPAPTDTGVPTGTELPGSPATLGFSEFDAVESARYGYGEALQLRQVLINERLAHLLDVAAGDSIDVAGVSLAVVHVFQGFGDVDAKLLVHTDTLPALGLKPVFDRLSVQFVAASPPSGTENGVGSEPPVDGAGRAVGALLGEQFPDLEISEREGVRARAFEIFDRTFAITRALTLLALGVAGVGIYNALMALRLAQAPTRRLLEAQGVRPGELVLVTLVRSASVGVLALLFALPLGIAMAWTLCQIVNPRAFGWTIGLHLAPGAWLPPLALGLVATVLAGLLPAPREQGGLDESA